MGAPSERGAGRRKLARAQPSEGQPAAAVVQTKGKWKTINRAEWFCLLCKIPGTANNQCSGLSPHAGHELVVLAGGTPDRPKGPVCLKCFSAWTYGGWREEYNDDMDKLSADQDKDDAVNVAFLQSGDVWLEAHNLGKRVREVKSQRYANKDGSTFAKMHAARTTRKRILKTKRRGLRAKTLLKFCTPEAYRKRFQRTLADDNLSADWHMVKGQKMWGVLVDMTPEGECDMEDYHDEGVEFEEEVESGGDRMRTRRATKLPISANQVRNLLGDFWGISGSSRSVPHIPNPPE